MISEANLGGSRERIEPERVLSFGETILKIFFLVETTKYSVNVKY